MNENKLSEDLVVGLLKLASALNSTNIKTLNIKYLFRGIFKGVERLISDKRACSHLMAFIMDTIKNNSSDFMESFDVFIQLMNIHVSNVNFCCWGCSALCAIPESDGNIVVH